MRFVSKGSLVSIFALCFALSGPTFSAIAQNVPPLDQPTPNSVIEQGTLTGKERLGRKWTDERRIDNCNVPIDKCRNTPRPSASPHVPTE
jgi:hypothetical protein